MSDRSRHDTRRSQRKLGRGEIEVWILSPPALSGAALARCLALLPEEEHAHVARFHFERNRREATASRALVRTTLAQYIDRAPISFRYRHGPYGQPFVAPPCGLHFNATNHPDLVACVVSLDEEIGVDVEPVLRGEQILEVAPDVFSPAERAALDALPPDQRLDRAVSLWTLKEAYIKARGLGLSAPLKEISVDFPPGQRPTVSFQGGVDVPDGWWLDTRDIGGFRIAVANRTTAAHVTLAIHEAQAMLDVLPSRPTVEE